MQNSQFSKCERNYEWVKHCWTTAKFRNKKVFKDRPVRIVPNFQNTVGVDLLGEWIVSY